MSAAEIYLAYEPEDIRPGWIALLIVLALAVATYFLWRSMNTQLRKINVPHRGARPESGTGEDHEDPPTAP